MSQQTITIVRAGLRGCAPISDEVDADVESCFAIHPTIPVRDDDEWTLTHIPTGYAFLSGVLEGQARACRAELLAGKLDWSTVHTPQHLTVAHKRVGKAMRQKYESVA